MTVLTLRRILVLALGALLAASMGPVSSAEAGVIRLGGVRVALQPGTTQVVTVNRTRSWHARVILWESTTHGWQAVARARNGRIGYGGLVAGARRTQGSGKTLMAIGR